MKQKINLRLGFIALIAIAFSSLGTLFVSYNLFQNQVINDLKKNANLLMELEFFENIYAQLEEGTYVINSETLDLTGVEDLRITWVASDGTVLYDNEEDASTMPNHLDRPEIKQAIREGVGETTRRSDTMNVNAFYYALLLDNGTVLRVSTHARTITSVFLVALPLILTIAAVIMIICVLIGHFLTDKLLKPLEEMTEHLDDSSRQPAYKELQPFADKIRSQHEDILAAVKMRQDFTANVSHELKTPITAITGYAELIENKLIDEASVPHIAHQIRRNADRLLSLVTDIIQLSELDHREIPRDLKQVNLYGLAYESVEDLRPMADNARVSLIYDGVAAGIHADSALIREMIDNLIQNAIRYNRENGSVWVCVTIENGHALLSVKDNGIGIPKDQQSRVFERFYRVDKSRSRETGGTGLGLAIVKHIAEIHSAEIFLTSEEGKGTEVKIRF